MFKIKTTECTYTYIHNSEGLGDMACWRKFAAKGGLAGVSSPPGPVTPSSSSCGSECRTLNFSVPCLPVCHHGPHHDENGINL